MQDRKSKMTKRMQRTLEVKPATSTSVDRISRLPDSVLCHILSFLPTISSVATSILSRRWRDLWKYVQVFNFSSLEFLEFGHRVPEHLVLCINAVLTQRMVRDIQKFSLLSEHRIDNYAATTWICAAIGPHLQELHLSLPMSNDICLSHRVFTCTALVSLTLTGGIILEQLSSVHLPSLKNLCVKMKIIHVNPINKLLSGCPILETLELVLCNDNAAKICMPSLKSLRLEYRSDIEELEIDTPSLEYLYIGPIGKCSQFSVSNLHNVVQAHLSFCCDLEHDGIPLQLLTALRKTKVLVLRNSELLFHAPTLDLPVFCCLYSLKIYSLCFNSRFLIDLLHNCHILQVLIIHKDALREDLETWTPPANVPKCVISHLTTFEFEGYEDLTDEHAFISYVLQKGLVLKTVTIRPRVGLELKKKYDIVRGLSAMPRGSNICQLFD